MHPPPVPEHSDLDTVFWAKDHLNLVGDSMDAVALEHCLNQEPTWMPTAMMDRHKERKPRPFQTLSRTELHDGHICRWRAIVADTAATGDRPGFVFDRQIDVSQQAAADPQLNVR